MSYVHLLDHVTSVKGSPIKTKLFKQQKTIFSSLLANEYELKLTSKTAAVKFQASPCRVLALTPVL